MKRSVINILDLSVEELDELIATANDIIENPKKYSEKCRGLKLATLFFEPSTRTRLSFEAAMYELGGNVLGFSEAQSSSAAKGESVADTAKTVSCYADIIAMRHPKGGRASGGCHERFGSCDQRRRRRPQPPHPDPGGSSHHLPGRWLWVTIGLCGDLKFGRDGPFPH